MSVKNCRLIDLPQVHDPRGNLTFIESSRHVPFMIKRIFYLYDVPGGRRRVFNSIVHIMVSMFRQEFGEKLLTSRRTRSAWSWPLSCFQKTNITATTSVSLQRSMLEDDSCASNIFSRRRIGQAISEIEWSLTGACGMKKTTALSQNSQ